MYGCEAGTKGFIACQDICELREKNPQTHYYDEPVVSREHLVDVFKKVPVERCAEGSIMKTTQPIKSVKPTVTCPYCGSTDTKKIGAVSRIADSLVWGLLSPKKNKQWHCNNCKSDF